MNWLRTNNPAVILAFVTIISALPLALYYEHWWLVALPAALFLGYMSYKYPVALLSLLWISLPLSFEFSFSDQLGTDLPDEPLMWGITLLSVCYLVYQNRFLRSDRWQHPLFICFLCWLGWMLVTTLLSETPWLSIKFLLAKTWYVGAFILAPLIWLRSRERLFHFLYCLFVPLFVLAMITLVRHAGEGFSFASVTEVVQPYFRNHVVYSAMLITLVPVLWLARQRANRTLGWDLAIACILAALYFSFARGAWLALIVGWLAYLLLQKRLLVYGYAMTLLLLFAVFIWLKQDDRYLQYAPDYKTTIFHPEFSEHWRATYQGKDVSTVERFYRWIAGVRMIEEKPITGFGPSSFYSTYRPYTVPAYRTWVSNNPQKSTIHNYFLLTAVEQGIPGLILFLLLFGAILFYAERIYHTGQADWQRQMAAGIGVIVVMLGVVNFWSDLIETDKIGSLFFLSISLLLILDGERSGRTGTHVQRIP